MAFRLLVIALLAVGLTASASALPCGAAAGQATGHGPAAAPVDGPLVRAFAPPPGPFAAGHRGVDLAAAPGEVVRAAMPGLVVFSGQVAGRGWVTLRHGGGLETTYGILEPRLVRAGQRVRAGEPLGLLWGGADHLDWGARLDDVYVDPLSLLGRWRVHLVETRARSGQRQR